MLLDVRDERFTPSAERTLRGWNKFLGTWNVCDNAACRRGRACRGNIRVCGLTNFARLPRGVQDWFLVVIAAKEQGLPFEETMAGIGKTPLAAAMGEWLAELPGAEGRGRRVGT